MVLAAVLAASAIGNCKSVKLVASVKNPNYSGERFHKVLVIGMSNDPAIRSDFEDAMASKLARDGVESIPGHSILLRFESANLDMDYLKAQIREHHIDAVAGVAPGEGRKERHLHSRPQLRCSLSLLQLVLRLLPHGLPAGLYPGLSARGPYGAHRN